MPAILTAVSGVGTLIPYIYFRIKRRSVPMLMLKVATSVFFLLTTLAATMQINSEYLPGMLPLCAAILAGQIFGLLGDYWLDMKDMYPQHKEPYIFAGFGSFITGHVCFVAGLIAVYGVDLRTLLISLGAGAVLLVLVLLMEKPMKLRYGKYKGISAGYSVLFGFIIALAFQLALFPFADGGKAPMETQPLVMGVGLVLFLLSDLVLSGTYFGKGKDRPIDYILNYILYYGAQFTIALSLLTLG